VSVCVARDQMKQPSPEACCPPAVAASLFLLPRPAATICSINRSPGASGANTHTSTGIHTSTTACTAHATHGPPSLCHPLLHPSLPPSDALLQTHAPSFFAEAIWPSEACGSTDTSAYMLLLTIQDSTESSHEHSHTSTHKHICSHYVCLSKC